MIKIHEVIYDFIQKKYFFVMDYMKKGVILSDQFMKQQKPQRILKENILTLETGLNYFRQLLCGINFS